MLRCRAGGPPGQSATGFRVLPSRGSHLSIGPPPKSPQPRVGGGRPDHGETRPQGRPDHGEPLPPRPGTAGSPSAPASWPGPGHGPACAGLGSAKSRTQLLILTSCGFLLPPKGRRKTWAPESATLSSSPGSTGANTWALAGLQDAWGRVSLRGGCVSDTCLLSGIFRGSKELRHVKLI